MGPLHLSYAATVERLRTALSEPLPGPAAHARLAPSPRRQWPASLAPPQFRDAAVLVAVYAIGDRAHIVLTVRSGALGRHSGQVSLPGGIVEPGETFEQAALREAHEEVALPVDRVGVIGTLTPLDIPTSGFRVHPVVAILQTRPSWVPARGEVDRILEIAIDDLLDEACLASNERERDGHRMLVPAFHIGGLEVWGATAMVLAEFLTLLGWPDRI